MIFSNKGKLAIAIVIVLAMGLFCLKEIGGPTRSERNLESRRRIANIYMVITDYSIEKPSELRAFLKMAEIPLELTRVGETLPELAIFNNERNADKRLELMDIAGDSFYLQSKLLSTNTESDGSTKYTYDLWVGTKAAVYSKRLDSSRGVVSGPHKLDVVIR